MFATWPRTVTCHSIVLAGGCGPASDQQAQPRNDERQRHEHRKEGRRKPQRTRGSEGGRQRAGLNIGERQPQGNRSRRNSNKRAQPFAHKAATGRLRLTNFGS